MEDHGGMMAWRRHGGMIVYTCNPSMAVHTVLLVLRKLRQEEYEFQAAALLPKTLPKTKPKG